MIKSEILKRISEIGVVAVVRGKDKEDAIKISESCILGGVLPIEITFTTPNAEVVIKELNDKYGEDILLGAGTVLDKETTQLAIDNGAKYIVSPIFDLESARLCKELKIPYLPGCMTITEMMTAAKEGSEVIKLFPGSVYGPGFIKAVKGPLPNINIMPTGGVDINNVHQWLESGAVAVGVGSKLTGPAKTGDYEGVTQLSRQFIARVKEVRGK